MCNGKATWVVVAIVMVGALASLPLAFKRAGVFNGVESIDSSPETRQRAATNRLRERSGRKVGEPAVSGIEEGKLEESHHSCEALSKMSVDEIRNLIRGNRKLVSDRDIALAIMVLADRSEGSDADFKLIVNSGCIDGQIQDALAILFRRMRREGREIDIGACLAEIPLGGRRSAIIRAIFCDPSAPLGDTVEYLSIFQDRRDRKDALLGLAESRSWEMKDLVPLVASGDQDITLIGRFLERRLMEYVASNDVSVLSGQWQGLEQVGDSSQKSSLQHALLCEVVNVNPEWAVATFKNQSSAFGNEMLAGFAGDQFMKGWTSKAPQESLDYVVGMETLMDLKRHLVGVGFSQWLVRDSTGAIQWLAANASMPYATDALRGIIAQLENRREDASRWKRHLK